MQSIAACVVVTYKVGGTECRLWHCPHPLPKSESPLRQLSVGYNLDNCGGMQYYGNLFLLYPFIEIVSAVA